MTKGESSTYRYEVGWDDGGKSEWASIVAYYEEFGEEEFIRWILAAVKDR